MNGAPICGVILAGGDSLRYSGGAEPKALARLGGAPLLLQVAAGLVRQGAGRIVVLTGRNHARLCAGLELTPAAATSAPPEFSAAHGQLNITWNDGRGSDIPFELRFSGIGSGTGGRLLALCADELAPHALLSYTDILSDVQVGLLGHACSTGAELAILAVQPRLPWGVLEFGDIADRTRVTGFIEKPRFPDHYVNGGQMALTGAVLECVHAVEDMLEREVMERLIERGSVTAVQHDGTWQSLETPKDISEVEKCLAAHNASWQTWDEVRLLN